MKIAKGLEILAEIEGQGEIAEARDKVVFNCKVSLNHGDEVRFVENQLADLRKRESIAAVRLSLIGMKIGGYRKIKASPHLAYGEEGVEGLIPKNAVLIIELWLKEVVKLST